MNKKSVLAIIYLALVFLYLGSVLAALDSQLEDVESGLEDSVDKVENIQDKIEDSNSSYLENEWKKIIMGNKVISGIDSGLTKISFVFEVLFGTPYSASLTFFFVVVFWFWFLLKFKQIFKTFSPFSSATSFLISLGMCIALAQFGMFEFIAKLPVWLISIPDALWLKVIVFFLIVLGLILISRLTTHFAFTFTKNKEELEKYQEKVERGVLHSFFSTIKKAWGG